MQGGLNFGAMPIGKSASCIAQHPKSHINPRRKRQMFVIEVENAVSVMIVLIAAYELPGS